MSKRMLKRIFRPYDEYIELDLFKFISEWIMQRKLMHENAILFELT
jgi:hypothetical protein